MLAARTQLRLAFEDGVGVALGRPSPTLAAREILERQFSASDDYDRLYFLTLGYLLYFLTLGYLVPGLPCGPKLSQFLALEWVIGKEVNKVIARGFCLLLVSCFG